MNSLESTTVVTPYNTEDECAKFVIDDTTDIFKLPGTMLSGNEYTFSCWIRSEEAGTVVVGEVDENGEWPSIIEFESTIDWTYFTYSFPATTTDLSILFQTTGTYYIYHPQLEKGNRATDWTPAPEDTYDRFDATDEAIEGNAEDIADVTSRTADVEASIQLLADSVLTVVEGTDGSTILKQDNTGWEFSITNLDAQVTSLQSALDALDTTVIPAATQTALDELHTLLNDKTAIASYIHVGEQEDGKPYIELGTVDDDLSSDTNLKLRITNTEMYFMNGSMVLTTITNQQMLVEYITINQEMQIGDHEDGNWVWKQRTNGNLGLAWKGATS